MPATEWLTHYCVLVLEWDSPIIEALALYWKWVKDAPNVYKRDPVSFPWEQYQDPVPLMRVAHFHPECLQWIPYTMQDKYPQLALSIIQRYPNYLHWARCQTAELCLMAMKGRNGKLSSVNLKELDMRGELHQYPDICMAAVQSRGIQLAVVNKQRAALQEYYPELCRAAVTRTGIALQYVPADIQEAHPDIVVTALKENLNEVKPYVKFRNMEIVHLMSGSAPHHRWGCTCYTCKRRQQDHNDAQSM